MTYLNSDKLHATQADNPKMHVMIHTGEKHYNCAQCQQSFIQAVELKIHIIKNSVEKHFNCAQCDQLFTHTGTLKRHMMKHSFSFSCKKLILRQVDHDVTLKTGPRLCYKKDSRSRLKPVQMRKTL